MQRSRSLATFAFSCGDSDREHLLLPNRPRKRSSLDTFVIPGRTRIPSHRSEPFDLQLTRNLMHPSAYPKEPNTLAPHHSHDTDSLFGPLNEPGFPSIDGPVPAGESIYRITRDSSPSSKDLDNIVVPPRQHQPRQLSSNNPYRNRRSASSQQQPLTYDGAHDLSLESRITSTSWSTVSKISHRIFSDTSDSSRGYASARYNHGYNELATKYGLPELKLNSTDSMNEKASFTSDKAGRHGWFARKFLSRSRATYTFKARTTYRPISRKKSFGRLSSSSDDGQRNILEGRSLEETCRLGGLGVLILPGDYCVETPTLPACLSVVATHILQHGVNAPGLFRVSGQASIVNALYDYYAHQFGQAGSPTKVQATVQVGQLPLHIEYNLQDMATFFKKVLKGLPGGLLGSVETFEAIHGILFKMHAEPSLMADELTILRAKLIALNFLSIDSLPRFHLIMAMFGLFAYLADEAESARNRLREASKEKWERPNPSELMGYQALGVCLGPLLLGDYIDKIDEAGNCEHTAPRVSIESIDRPRKKRNSILGNKLQNSAGLTVLVGKANLTANIMQLLLMIWRDVVKQMRVLTAPSKMLDRLSLQRRPRVSSRKISKHSVRVTDEELLFLDMLRGGEVPTDFPYDVTMKRKVRAKGKASMPQVAHQLTLDSPLHRDWFHKNSEQREFGTEQVPEPEGKRKPTVTLISPSALDLQRGEMGETLEGQISPSDHESDVFSNSEDMLSGQILQSRNTFQDLSPPESSQRLALGSPLVTPTRQPRSHRTSNSTPEATVRGLLATDKNGSRGSHRRTQTVDRPPLQLRRGLPPPPVEPPANLEASFPPRHSSLENYALLSGLDSASGAGFRRAGSSKNHIPLIQTQSYEQCSRALNEQASYQQACSFSSSAPSSGRGRIVKDSAPKLDVPFIPPYESLYCAQEDPFVSRDNPNTPRKRESLIPEPVSRLGKRREEQSKSPPSQKRRSMFNVVMKNGETNGTRVAPLSPKSAMSGGVESTGGFNHNTVPTRPLSAYTLESLRSLEEEHLETPARILHFGGHSRGVSGSSAPDANTGERMNPPSETLLGGSGRKATNNTLFAEITRLKRQLDQKDEILRATRRSLDAARMAKEEGPSRSGSSTPKRGSWTKGTLSYEVWDIRKQRDNWRQRAEWAERRLGEVEWRGRSEDGRLNESGSYV